MFSPLRRFWRKQDGNVAIFFAMMLIPFLIIAGMAVDYGRAVVAKHEVQVALDAAVLAAGSLKSASPKDRKALGRAFFEANLDTKKYGATVPGDLIAINDNKISADQSVKVQSAFMHLSGLLTGSTGTVRKGIEVSTDATALVPQVSQAEIALVLDYSGSMDSNLNGARKYRTMRNAAIDLITKLHSGPGKSDGVKFALVPFSYGVKARLMGRHLTSPSYQRLSGDTRIESCLSGRKVNATNDSEPRRGKRHRWQQDDLWYDRGPYNSSRTYKCRDMHLMRELTSNTATLIADLKSWTPDGGTHISSGFQFGWHAISPNSVFTGGAPYSATTHKDPAQRVIKAIVLLTDGAQTVPDYRRNGLGQINPIARDRKYPMDKANGEHNLTQMCAKARNKGVLVVTVAFDLNDDDTVKRLARCATPVDKDLPGGDTYAFQAESIAELNSAFQQIGNVLGSMVYLSN